MPRVRFFLPLPGKAAGDFTAHLYRLSLAGGAGDRV